ncbi:MAG: hypothetical protein MUO99_04080 [Dehalococcoidales bacterium]|nr:hypothetical protein [Dehalococcoidales bacterium]
MAETNVGATQFGETLMAYYLDTGLNLQFTYESGRHFPSISLNLDWVEWERFVAWVELQRKEHALEKAKKPT